MKYRPIFVSKKWCFLFSLVFLCGCASKIYIEKHTNEWISRPIAELKAAMSKPDSYASKTGWRETIYPQANGYYVYVEPLSEDCSIHWDVNPQDNIVGYRAVGSGCEQTSSDTGNLRKMTAPLPPGSW